MTQEQTTMWAVFDKDGKPAFYDLLEGEGAAMARIKSFPSAEAQGYYAAPAKIVEVK